MAEAIFKRAQAENILRFFNPTVGTSIGYEEDGVTRVLGLYVNTVIHDPKKKLDKKIAYLDTVIYDLREKRARLRRNYEDARRFSLLTNTNEMLGIWSGNAREIGKRLSAFEKTAESGNVEIDDVEKLLNIYGTHIENMQEIFNLEWQRYTKALALLETEKQKCLAEIFTNTQPAAVLTGNNEEVLANLNGLTQAAVNNGVEMQIQRLEGDQELLRLQKAQKALTVSARFGAGLNMDLSELGDLSELARVQEVLRNTIEFDPMVLSQVIEIMIKKTKYAEDARELKAAELCLYRYLTAQKIKALIVLRYLEVIKANEHYLFLVEQTTRSERTPTAKMLIQLEEAKSQLLQAQTAFQYTVNPDSYSDLGLDNDISSIVAGLGMSDFLAGGAFNLALVPERLDRQFIDDLFAAVFQPHSLIDDDITVMINKLKGKHKGKAKDELEEKLIVWQRIADIMEENGSDVTRERELLNKIDKTISVKKRIQLLEQLQKSTLGSMPVREVEALAQVVYLNSLVAEKEDFAKGKSLPLTIPAGAIVSAAAGDLVSLVPVGIYTIIDIVNLGHFFWGDLSAEQKEQLVTMEMQLDRSRRRMAISQQAAAYNKQEIIERYRVALAAYQETANTDNLLRYFNARLELLLVNGLQEPQADQPEQAPASDRETVNTEIADISDNPLFAAKVIDLDGLIGIRDKKKAKWQQKLSNLNLCQELSARRRLLVTIAKTVLEMEEMQTRQATAPAAERKALNQQIELLQKRLDRLKVWLHSLNIQSRSVK